MPRQAKCLPCWDRRDAGQPTPAQIGETLPAEQCTPSATGSGGPVAAFCCSPPPLHHPSTSPSGAPSPLNQPIPGVDSGWRWSACWATARGTCVRSAAPRCQPPHRERLPAAHMQPACRARGVSPHKHSTHMSQALPL